MKIYKHRHTKHPYITPQVIFEELEVDGVLQDPASIKVTGPDGEGDGGNVDIDEDEAKASVFIFEDEEE